MAYLYRHMRLDTNQVFYVGVGNVEIEPKQNYYKRAYNRAQRSQYWKKVANKTPIEVEIMMEGMTYKEAQKKEIEFIALYKRTKDGGTLVNLTDGGDGTVGAIQSEEQKKKTSILFKGKVSPLRGRKLSDEHRRNMSLAGKGRPSHRKGKQLPPETVEKMRLGLQTKHPWTGRKHTKESKIKVGLANAGKKPVLQFKDGVLINEYVNLIVCAGITGFGKECIMSAIKGRRKTYKGCTWLYKGEPTCKYHRTYKRKKVSVTT